MSKRSWQGFCCRTCARGRGARKVKTYTWCKRVLRRAERHAARDKLRGRDAD